MSPRPRPRSEVAAREDRQHELVLAAFNQIAARGFEGLRTREVAGEVGLNIATLHYYFPTKEALIGGVLDEAMRRFRSTLEPHGSPADQLRNHFRAVQKLLRTDSKLRAVMGELALRSARDRMIAGILRGTNDAWYKTLRGLLRRAAKEGHLRRGLDIDDAAALIVAALTSMMLPTVSSADRIDQTFRQLERMLGVPGRAAG
jgi:AcrR family transcriptional regulator